jgi:saccharopepsin
MHEIPLFSAGVRKGDMLSMSVESAVLDFGTPFITLPAGLWDVLVLATRPVLRPRGGGLGHRGDALMSVECAARSRFPDLVFGISGDNGEEELVVRPEQYVLQREGGECILLVKGAEERDEEDVVVGLGWAVGRGRQVVFDWEEGRIGLGELKG